MMLAPGIVEMRDTDKQTYLVDQALADILINRRVWTDKKTGQLMIDEVHPHAKTVIAQPLAVWWYRIMHLNELPHVEIIFKDHNPRNLTYSNLLKVKPENYPQESESMRHASTDQHSHPNV